MRFNVYDNVKLVGGVSLTPQSVSGSTAVDGNSVDTEGYDNAAIHVYADAASGSPTAATLAVTLQESADDSTWTTATDNTGTDIGFTLTVTSAAAENVARIEGLNLNRKRYLRAVVTPSFTGGTSPASIVVGEIVLGNAESRPVDSNVSNT